MHKKFMAEAIRLAKQALERSELPVGAVITLNNEIIGRGVRDKNHHIRLGHAEMIALEQAVTEKTKKRAHEMILYTTLEPCIMCFGSSLNCRIGTIAYAVEDPYGGALEIPKEAMPPRHAYEFPKIIDGILREEARDLFRQFFETTTNPFWQHKDNPLVAMCLNKWD